MCVCLCATTNKMRNGRWRVVRDGAREVCWGHGAGVHSKKLRPAYPRCGVTVALTVREREIQFVFVRVCLDRCTEDDSERYGEQLRSH